MNKRAFKIPGLSLFKVRARLSTQEQVLFARRLSLLVKAGVPLLKSVNMLKQQSASSANRKMFEHISHDIANGQFLSKSLSHFRKVFGDFAINIIRIGETTGTLAESLKYLADEMDKKRILRQKVIGALIYPLVIMFSAFSVSGLMTIYLFPKLLPIFNSLHVPLPFMTRAMIYFSDVLLKYWPVLLGGLAILAVSCILLMRFKRFRLAVHAMLLKLPLAGGLFTHYHIINICRTLGTLFKNHVHVLEGITVTAETTTNLVYKRNLQNLYHSVTRGGNLAKYFEENPKLFPGMLSQMIAIGEATGNLSESLLYLADMYEQELDEQTKRLSSVIEPAMMLLMGLLVGFVAISIITPIYEVTQHLNPR